MSKRITENGGREQIIMFFEYYFCFDKMEKPETWNIRTKENWENQSRNSNIIMKDKKKNRKMVTQARETSKVELNKKDWRNKESSVRTT